MPIEAVTWSIPVHADWDRHIAQRTSELAGNPCGATRFGISQHQDELLAAKANRGVAGARDATQLGGDTLQHGVTGGVPASVVDGLEVIEVDEDHAERHATPL